MSSCGKGNTLLLLGEATVNQREEGSLEQADVFSASQSFGMDGCGGEQPELFIRVCLNKSVSAQIWKKSVLWRRSCFRSDGSNQTLKTSVRMGQALIGLAAALEMGG